MSEPADKYPSIKSFVRRNGRMTPSQKKAIESWWEKYGIDYQPGPLDLPGEFDSVTLEIGIGNGDALVSMASADRNSLYIGIEVHQPGIGRCLNTIRQQNLDNVRLVSHDAIEVLQSMIAPNSVDRVLLFFPDPWHKKRHHKRRIVNPGFLDLLHRCLKPGGQFHAATDWQDYADHMSEVFLADSRFSSVGDDAGFVSAPDYRPITRFEQRGRRLGHGVWDLIFMTRPANDEPE